MRSGEDFSYDWLVIGTGFGGSVAALRLAEKGYTVGMLERGRRFEDSELPDSSWRLRDAYWMPKLGLRGLWKLTLFRDVFIVSGAGVGGGSLVYANTLYRADAKFRDAYDAACGEHVDLDPHYGVAERMLGVVTSPRVTRVDELSIRAASELGYGDSFRPTPVGVFFGEPGETVADPYFGGDGPNRTGCIECGECLLGCRHGAKNTLRKNYLWFAERLGVDVRAERAVTDIRPLAAADGSDGYEIVSERPGAWVRRAPESVRARGVVLAAGALGTNGLLATCRASGSLPRLSARIGHLVRTNSESIGGVTARDPDADYRGSIVLTGSLFPDERTHIEYATYGDAGDTTAMQLTMQTGPGGRLVRSLELAAAILRRPRDFLRTLRARRKSRRTIFTVAMQEVDNALRLVARRRRFGRGVRLQTRQDPDNPIPTYIPELNEFTAALAGQVDGVPQSWCTEALAGIPITAHVLGGAVIAQSPDDGVVDQSQRVYGYENMLVCDGSAVPFNPGVNPALTITAMSERAMSLVPAKAGARRHPPRGRAPEAQVSGR